jgi:hypothetical protein
VTNNRRRQGRFAAAGLAILLISALSACGSSSPSSAGATGGAGSSPPTAVVKALGKLTTCLGAHGVKVPAPVTRKGVRTTIRDLPSAQRSTVITDCQTQIDALLAMRPGH